MHGNSACTPRKNLPRPLRLYAHLELGIALSKRRVPFLLALATRAYVALGGTAVLGSAGAALTRLLLTALVLFAPTVLIGGTLPALGAPRSPAIATRHAVSRCPLRSEHARRCRRLPPRHLRAA